MSSQSNGSRLVRKYYSRTQQMEIVIETLSGTAFEMTVLPTETIFSIKAKIQRVEGIPISHQHLIHNMRELQDDEATLADCGLRNGSRLRLVLSLRGGPISTRRLPLLSCSDAESEQDLGFEPVPSGSHIVLLMQDGEQLSLFKVVENDDGTFSPMAESWSSRKPMQTMTDEAEGEDLGTDFDSSAMENRAQENAATRSKVQDLRLKMEQLSLQKKKKKSQTEKPIPLTVQRAHHTTSAISVHAGPNRRDWVHHLPSLPHIEPPSAAAAAAAPAPAPLSPRHIDIQPTLRPILPPIASARPLPAALTTQRSLGRAQDTMYECLPSESMPSVSTASAVELQARSSHPVRQTHLSHFVLDNRPKTSPEKLYVVGHSLAQEIQKETQEMCRILGEVRRRHWSQELANRTAETPRISPPLTVAAPTQTSEQPTMSGQASKKPRRWRCSQCRRKLNITNAHTCRCGKHFCASHRYAETHNCTYDYKADGKKFLAQNNPLVIATKLPKI